MDGRFEWREEYSVGVEDIDKEHQRLFQIINKLFAFREEEKDSQWLGQEGIKYFKGHAMKHFADEESYMESIGHPELERHRAIHQGFRENTLPALEQELERTGYAPDAVNHFLGVCAGWLIGHTLTEDLSITGKHMRKWENLLPGEELTAMKKVIIQLVFDMFRLESQLISDAYGGEKFGRGVYYRLVYGTGKGEKKQEILLVFEENLLVNTVGKALGLQTNKLDSMLVHAARYTARQFVGRIMEHFPEMDAYTLQGENLLSYEQFQKIIEKETPQVSLLFNTGGAGYFAYCAIAPHLLELLGGGRLGHLSLVGGEGRTTHFGIFADQSLPLTCCAVDQALHIIGADGIGVVLQVHLLDGTLHVFDQAFHFLAEIFFHLSDGVGEVVLPLLHLGQLFIEGFDIILTALDDGVQDLGRFD